MTKVWGFKWGASQGGSFSASSCPDRLSVDVPKVCSWLSDGKSMSQEQRASVGIYDTTLRLSVGVEVTVVEPCL